jgi:hypothetical protein
MTDAPPKRPWVQFGTRGIFVAITWFAVFAFNFVLFKRLWRHELVAPESEGLAYLVVGSVLFVSLPAAIGGLFGRTLTGAVAGLVLFTLIIGWVLFTVSMWGI